MALTGTHTRCCHGSLVVAAEVCFSSGQRSTILLDGETRHLTPNSPKQNAAASIPFQSGAGQATTTTASNKRKSSSAGASSSQDDARRTGGGGAPLAPMAPATQLDRQGLGRRVGLASILLSEPFVAKLMYRHASDKVPEACGEREMLPRDHPIFAPLLQLLDLGDYARPMFRAGTFGVRSVEDGLTRTVLPCVVALHARAEDAVAAARRRGSTEGGFFCCCRVIFRYFGCPMCMHLSGRRLSCVHHQGRENSRLKSCVYVVRELFSRVFSAPPPLSHPRM